MRNQPTPPDGRGELGLDAALPTRQIYGCTRLSQVGGRACIAEHRRQRGWSALIRILGDERHRRQLDRVSFEPRTNAGGLAASQQKRQNRQPPHGLEVGENVGDTHKFENNQHDRDDTNHGNDAGSAGWQFIQLSLKRNQFRIRKGRYALRGIRRIDT